MPATSIRLVGLAMCFIALGLNGCGGGGGSGNARADGLTAQPAPAPSPAPGQAPSPPAAPAPAPLPLPAGVTALYFADCQVGAASDCVTGSNANSGFSADAAKQNLAGIDVNSLPAGTQLLMRRGGAWNWTTLRLENPHTSASAPLVVGDYGSGARPLLRVASGDGFEIGGGWNNSSNDGGYTLRNLKLDGLGSAQWGLLLRENVYGVLVEGVEITGFEIAIHSQSGAPYGVANFVLRNASIVRNSGMGLLGSFRGALIEESLFEGNNISGSTFNHAVYLGGTGNDVVIRNSRFLRNSVANGQCTGGNITAHGQWDRVTLEGNVIEQDRASGGCYGISITPGYDSAESMRNFVVRGNTIVNLGDCAICAGAAPNITVAYNRIINTQATYQVGVVIPAGNRDANDAEDGNAAVHNNVVCLQQPSVGSAAVRVSGTGSVAFDNALFTALDVLNIACAR